MSSEILVLSKPIEASELKRLAERWDGDMVKFVADLRRGLIAVGGEMHADAERVLLESGGAQADLWGANYYPGRGEGERIEFTSLINIRPRSGNRSMEIQDREIRQRVTDLTHSLLGRGEPRS